MNTCGSIRNAEKQYILEHDWRQKNLKWQRIPKQYEGKSLQAEWAFVISRVWGVGIISNPPRLVLFFSDIGKYFFNIV